MNVEKKHIDPEKLKPKPVEQLSFEVEIPTKLKGKKKFKKKDINLNLGNGLRLIERFLNKWLNWLIGNDTSPIPDVGKINLTLLILIIILILIFFLR